MTKKSLSRLFVLTLLFSLLISPPEAGQAQGSLNNKLYFPVIARPDPPVWMGPYGGSVVALAAAPGEPKVDYAGTGQAGVFRSDDGGISWQPANSGLVNELIDSLAVHPKKQSGSLRGNAWLRGIPNARRR